MASLDKCLATLQEKKRKVCEGKFENNNIAIQQALEELRDDSFLVKQVKDQLAELKKTKSHTKEYRATESEHDITEDLHLQRKRGLESLLYVSELENAFAGVQDDFETRALYLSQRPEVFKAVYRDHCPAAKQMHTECVEAMRESWRWLSDLTTCLNTHLHNAAHYQQFWHDLRHLEADLEHYLIWLETQPLRAPVKTKDPELMASHFRVILHHLLELQGRVERLCERSKFIYPVHLRKQMQPSRQIRAQALVNYHHRQVSLLKDDYCTVISNSDAERWMVQTSDGREAEVPALILVIPPPDPDCFDNANRTRGQMSVHWQTTAERLRGQLVQFFNNLTADTQTREFSGISSSQKSGYMKLLNEATRLLRGKGGTDPEYEKLHPQLVNLRKVLGQIKAGTRDAKNPTILKWNSTHTVFRLFTDLLVYGHAYRHEVSEHITDESVHFDLHNHSTYISKAYFERAFPSVSIDVTTKATQVTNIKCEIYIHERNKGRSSGIKDASRRVEKQEVNLVAGEKDFEETQFQLSEERSKFVIVGIIDPRSRQQISVHKAISKHILDLKQGTYNNPDTDFSISIPEAIQRELILVEYGDNFANGSSSIQNGGSEDLTLLNAINTHVCPISGVIDPRTGEWISVPDAVTAGLIDAKSGRFHNPVTGEEMSVVDAVRGGYLIAERAAVDDDTQERNTYTSVAMLDIAYKLSGVVDPRTGKIISLQQAIQEGIIDPVKGTFTDPVTGEVLSLEEAIRHGLIKGRPFDPVKDRDTGDVLRFKQLQIRQQRFQPPTDIEISSVVNGRTSLDPNEKLLTKIKEKLDTHSLQVKDPSTKRNILLEEAFEKGIINFARAEFDTLDGEILPLHEAMARGFMEPYVLKEILKAYQESCVGELIEQGKFDAETGLITDMQTGQILSLEAAIANEIIDPECTFFFDLPTNRVISLKEAHETGRFNLASGKVIKSGTDEELSVKDAEGCCQIMAKIDPNLIASTADSLSALRDVMDTKIRGVKVPSTGYLANVEEAVTLGLLDLPHAAYADVKTCGIVPLQLAVKKAKVELQVAKALFGAFSKLSLQNAIDSGKLNPKTGKFVRPDNKQSVDLETARKSGVWNPDLVYCQDNEAGQVTTLGALLDQDKLDAKSGRLTSATTGRSITLEEAIKSGVLTPTIEVEKHLDTTSSLKELIDNGQVNPRSTNFVAPNDHSMSLRDALANGFLTLGSKVKVDPNTGDIMLASDEQVVRVLVDVKESTDWLSDVERAMVNQGRPSQRLQRLKEQAEEAQGLKIEISRKESEVRLTIQQAENLMSESNGGQKDELAQQVQKLKYNAADLKLRMDTVSSEAAKRSSKMARMKDSLEEVYFRLDEIDQWLDSAIEQMQELPPASLEEQYKTFKDFVEEVKSKEDDIHKLVKKADEFKDQTQDFEHDVDFYRKRLQILPTIKEDGEAGVLDEEIESVEAKYKDISRECARQMDRLMGLVKNKKGFDELNDKLSIAYPALQEQLADIQNHTFGRDPNTDSADRDALKNIKADLLGQERKVKDLSTAGSRLAEGLEEANMTSEAEEVRHVVEVREEQHAALLEEVGEQEEQLDALLHEQQNISSHLYALEESIAQAEDKLTQNADISLDQDRLAVQIQEQHLMNADISSSKTLLDRLSREAHDMPETIDQLAAISDRLDAVEQKAESRTKQLDEIAATMQEFESKSSDMAHWLAESTKEMKTQTKSKSGKSQKAKIQGLLEAKEERQGAMKELHDACEALMADGRVTDTYAVKECLADLESRWNELTELLVKEISYETVADVEGILKYLDKAENEVNTAEPISIDPETLRVQLRDHNVFHEDLTQRKNVLKDVIAKGRTLLHDMANTKTDEIESRWDSIENQADLLCQHSADRLRQLESALPLATHLNENLAEVEAWLEEMEAELKSQGQPGDSLEEVKKQHDTLKGTQQIIDDHKLFIDDLNSTGMDLVDLCGVSDATDLHSKLLNTNNRYETLRSQARFKGRELAEKKRRLTQEVSDSLDHMLEDLDALKRVVSNADPVPSNPAKLRNEIDENRAVIEDLDNMKSAFGKLEEVVRNPKVHGLEDPGEVEDVNSKAAEIAELATSISKEAAHRDKVLNQVLTDASQFCDLSTDIMSSLRDLKDSLFSQQLPGVDAETIREQQGELAGIKTELEKAKELIGECRQHADNVMSLCGDPGRIELTKQLEDLAHMADDVNDTVRERGDELRKAFRHADQFAHLLDTINSWLPLSEHKLASMRPPGSDPAVLKTQIEEIKLFKSQIYPRIVEMQELNQQLDALKDQSPLAAESLYRPVLAANDKWNDLLRGIADREAKLNDMQVKVGQVDRSLNDVIGTLDQLQADIKNQDDATGDPKHLETILRKLQLMQSDIHNQEKTGRKLVKAVEEIVQRSGAAKDSPLPIKLQAMAQKLRTTKTLAKDAENHIQDKMRQVKRFLGELDKNLQAINDFRQELKNNLPFGALPETAEAQYNIFLKRCQDLDGREKSLQNLLTTGQQIADGAHPEHVTEIADKTRRLKERWQDTRDRAFKRKTKMEEHRQNVNDFHNSLKAFTDWLNATEVSMRAFVYPSKLVDRVTKQIAEHEAIRADLEAQSEKMATLDRTGTYLKHFGRKQDTIYVKNLLVGIRLRWKKILRRTDERGRILQQAYKEDKRFYDAWKELCNWLDESSATLSRFLTPGKQQSNLMKSGIDELKKFQLQLTAKHPTFFATTRLGRNLKDRCTKTDPERDVLNTMLEELRHKWNAVRIVVTKSQNKLDEALLTSGRVSDALQSLLEWLHKAEMTLADDLPVLGDLDTVNMLIEQHRNLQQELSAREPTVTTMKTAGSLPHTQNEELSTLWDRVNYLCEVRENKLTDALKLAEEFQEVVTVMREFLPEAEAQLKFKSLPDDEVAILQMIEKHDKFEEELRSHQEHVDKIKTLAEEILSSCHPNAVRFVKYYLTITQTRWDQLLDRAKQRGERLSETQHKLHGLAQSLEDMLAMLTEYQALLATKERDPIPHDLRVVGELLKEHQEVYAELIKLSESEDFMKIMATEAKVSASPSQKNGSNMRLNEIGRYNPRYAVLQNKWRTVSRMAIERKKRLQDAYDELQELESFKNFDFASWRARYLKWIQAKKFRITDFFRRQDKDGDGFLIQEEFVNGMLQSRFPTTRTELGAVFDIFDRERRGLIDYKDFVDALKPDKLRNTNRSDDEVIQDTIQAETSSCTCRHNFTGHRIDEGKYRFGEKQKIVLVRLLNRTVMVRVGGGWIPLDEFILNNDPCKAKGRTNFDLREQLLPDDTTTHTIHTFTPRRSSTGRISPSPSAASKRRQNDTGYASSTSSAGSGDSSLRRSRVTSSMVNLSTHSPSLQRNPDYGSTGNLSARSRTPRTSTSSTGRRTPTTHTERRRSGTITPRSTTPTFPTVAFGSSVRPRPTTPNSFSSTPPRPSSATPTPRSGSVTPTRQLGGVTRHRRLPNAPTTPRTPGNQNVK